MCLDRILYFLGEIFRMLLTLLIKFLEGKEHDFLASVSNIYPRKVGRTTPTSYY